MEERKVTVKAELKQKQPSMRAIGTIKTLMNKY